MQIKDHVFIVTGASSGIGIATAVALSDRGAKVALLARSTEALDKLAQQLPGSLPVTVDMTQFDRVREAMQRVHAHYGRIDGLVNNAGRSYAAVSRGKPVSKNVEKRATSVIAGEQKLDVLAGSQLAFSTYTPW